MHHQNLDLDVFPLPPIKSDTSSTASPSAEKTRAVATVTTYARPASLAAAASAAAPLPAFLPPPAPLATLQARLAALFHDIAAHIDLYYRDVQAAMTPSMEAELAGFGAAARGDEPIVDLLRGARQPKTVLTHCLMAYVLSLTAPSSAVATRKRQHGHAGQAALFPRDLLGVVPMPAQADKERGYTALQALYHRLAAQLYVSSSPSSSASPFASSPASPTPTLPAAAIATLQPRIRAAAEHFSLTFFPWADPLATDQDKDDHLAGVIADALDTALWLFAQVGAFDVDWDRRSGSVSGSGSIVVMPRVSAWAWGGDSGANTSESSGQKVVLVDPFVKEV